jgi:hypothetical protein
MPERNRRTLKLLLPLALLALAARAWFKRNPATVVESVRTPMSEPVTDPTPPPLRTRSRPHSLRRLALVSAYTTLFFAGAAFTAVAGDQSVGLPEEDAAWTQETAPAPEAAPEVTPEAAPTEAAAPAEAVEAVEAAPAADPYLETDLAPPPAAKEPTAHPTAAPQPAPASAPARAVRVASPASTPAPAGGSWSGPATSPTVTKKWVLERATAAPANPPEVEHSGDATIWLNRALPDPTPASKRLTRPFARQLVSISRRHHADWAAVLGVLRAQGDRGSAPATSAELNVLAERLSGRDAWRGALAISGRTAFADRADALADLYRSVGVEALVTGLEVAKDRLVERLLNDEQVWMYDGGRDDLEHGWIDVRLVVLIGYLVERHGSITVSCLLSGHRLFARPGVVSAHIYGHAVDIAAIGGTLVAGHQEPGGPTEQAVRSVLLLPAELQPQQVISLLGLGGPSFALSDHGDHIHVGY